jgi:hypothetical protein
MSWKKYFKVPGNTALMSPLGNSSVSSGPPAYRNYQSNLPEVYTGHPNRIERYSQCRTRYFG